MYKLIASLLVAATLATSSASIAAAPMAAKAPPPAVKTTTGVVSSVSTKFCTVALSNMSVYVFAKGCKLSKVTVGEWVSITWWAKGNLRLATKIWPAKKPSMADMMKMGMMH